MFKKINIKYLVIFFLFMLLSNNIIIPKELVNILRTNTFNLFFILVLIKFNNNNLTNLFIYLSFLIIICKGKKYENFSDIDNLKEQKLSLEKEIFDIEFKIIPVFKKNIEKNNKSKIELKFNIDKNKDIIDSYNLMNEVNSNINLISKSRHDAIKQNMDSSVNDLKGKIKEIDTNITLLNNKTINDKNKLKEINDPLNEISVIIDNKKTSLESTQKNVKNMNLKIVKLELQVEEEAESEQQFLLKTELKNAEEELEKEEDTLDKITVDINNQISKKEELESEKLNLENDIKKSTNKISDLKELKVEIEDKINNFNNICDNKLNTLLSTVNKNIYYIDKEIKDNNNKIKSVESINNDKNEDIEKIENKDKEINSELTTYKNKKESLTTKINEISLKIAELENPE